MSALEQSSQNTRKALELYDDVVQQRETYKRLLEELTASVKEHIAICHPDHKVPNFEQWMN
jgi:hypothetical protein